jgi:hypothetical protein
MALSRRLFREQHPQSGGKPGLFVFTQRKAVGDVTIAIQKKEKI